MPFLIFFVIFILSLMFHELGHAWQMYKNGVQINKIGIGLPLYKPILSLRLKRYNNILFEIHPIPLGAFVEPTSSGLRTLTALPYKSKANIYAAGPWANFVFGLSIILTIGLINMPVQRMTFYIVSSCVFIFLLIFRKIFSRYLIYLCGLFTTLSVINSFFSDKPEDTLSGPIGIVSMAHKFSINYTQAILFGATISMAIGLFNTLPIYPLDGGKIVEAMIKKQTSRKIYQQLGLGLILMILGFAITNDLINLFK